MDWAQAVLSSISINFIIIRIIGDEGNVLDLSKSVVSGEVAQPHSIEVVEFSPYSLTHFIT